MGETYVISARLKRTKRPWRTFGANYFFSHVKSRDKSFSLTFQGKREIFGLWRPIIVRFDFGVQNVLSVPYIHYHTYTAYSVPTIIAPPTMCTFTSYANYVMYT